VELLVVMVVIAIALSIVTPTMTNSYDAWQLRSTGRQLLALLRFASENARNGAGSVACYYKDGQLIVSRDGTAVRTLEVPSAITVAPQAPNGALFLPTGQMLSSAEFTLTNQRGRKIAIRSGPLYGQISLIEGAP
jgi:type II secretory pathway pseudopilin PulG